ncbi:MAG: hypothetical protein US13_C0009G0065 [candidate division TM6 bacterium GW2011_GWE2_36_25]|nr:MAG: hypothetical protein US13_C0009G0065 [candidate division TM6 bacterium GW2011_GWE2_36_25]
MNGSLFARKISFLDAEHKKVENLKKITTLIYNGLKQFTFKRKTAGVAQLVEQLICNQQVVGSSPTASSILC